MSETDKMNNAEKMIPNMVTLAALSSGLTAIRMALDSNWNGASSAIVLAFFLDGLDGKLARLLNAVSQFGAELDSLADVINFGVAPAIIMYLWSLHTLGNLGWIIVLVYVICTVLRLARFNVMMKEEEESSRTTGHQPQHQHHEQLQQQQAVQDNKSSTTSNSCNSHHHHNVGLDNGNDYHITNNTNSDSKSTINKRRSRLCKTYFIGVPAPAGAMMVMSPLMIELASPPPMTAAAQVQIHPMAVMFIMICVSGLLVSEIPTFTLKDMPKSRHWLLLLIVIVGFSLHCLYYAPWLTCVEAVCIYTLSIPVGAWQHRRQYIKSGGTGT